MTEILTNAQTIGTNCAADMAAAAAASDGVNHRRAVADVAAILTGSTGRTIAQIAYAYSARTGNRITCDDARALATEAGAQEVGKAYDALSASWVPTYAIASASKSREQAELAQRIITQYGIHEPQAIWTADMSDCHELDDVLIEGRMRTNSIGIISAQSKAGKTQLLAELAVACTADLGSCDESHPRFNTWLGLHVAPTPTLYINLELKDLEFRYRVEQIKSARGIRFPLPGLKVLTLRGTAINLTELVPVIEQMVDEINATEGRRIGLIIIDPLYRIITGDENSNSDVTAAYAQVSKLNEDTGASVIIAHHYAKGNSALKSVLDRGVGAGVFSRAPDMIATLSKIDTEELNTPSENATAFRMECVCRSFAIPSPVDCWYEYPLHNPVTDGSTDGAKLEGEADNSPAALAKSTESRNKILALAADSVIRMMIASGRVCSDRKNPNIYGITLADFKTEYTNRTEQKIGDTVATRYVKSTGREKIGVTGKSGAALYAFKNHPIVRTSFGYREDDQGAAAAAAASADRLAATAQAIENMGGPVADEVSGNRYGKPQDIARETDAELARREEALREHDPDRWWEEVKW